MNWLDYFQHNRANRRAIPWEAGLAVEPHLRAALIGSLRKFQVGESGEGRHLRAGARKTGDAGYARTIDLFIEEEQEHARLLARLIEALGGALLYTHWSDLAFVALRRMMGLKLELMVLLAAELIAKRYYRALDEATTNTVLSTVFGQIREDEEGHIAFHLETLNGTFGRWPWGARALAYSGWQWMFRIISALVAWDHRQLLRAVSVPPLEFWLDCNAIFEVAAWHVFRPASSPDNRLLSPVQ